MTLSEQLASGAAQLGLSLPHQSQNKLLEFLTLLEKWNRVYSLTSVREPAQMVSQHLLDCLAIVPHVSASSALDLGSGAGLPGIPLALALPNVQVTLLDSNQKKAAFIRQAVIELGIDNASVACSRVQGWQPGRLYDLIVSRAFSDLGEFVGVAGHLLGPDGALAAMKGAYPEEELGHVPPGFRLRAVHRLAVPGLAAERHLVMIERP